eukprot:COSAG01_NODE_1115_length_11643_cov_197.836798_10_plen_167_part_00
MPSLGDGISLKRGPSGPWFACEPTGLPTTATTAPVPPCPRCRPGGDPRRPRAAAASPPQRPRRAYSRCRTPHLTPTASAPARRYPSLCRTSGVCGRALPESRSLPRGGKDRGVGQVDRPTAAARPLPAAADGCGCRRTRVFYHGHPPTSATAAGFYRQILVGGCPW